jgi:hypothetical protein
MFKKCKKPMVFFLCLMLVLSCIITVPVYAKGKKGKLTVTYKGKEVTLLTVNDVNNEESKYSSKGCISPEKLKKSWGDYKKQKESGTSIEKYTYKKGKSTVSIWDTSGDDSWHSLTVKIKDKNMALCGVKVGMSKQKAIKILKKRFGSKAITATNDSISVNFGPFLPISYTLKSGKITSMSFWHS